VLTALLPLAVLKVTQVIIDDVYNLTARHQSLPSYFWWLVALEFGLASLAAILVRMINFCDVVLADKYSRHISTKIMEHASKLDLTSFEDPSFYDRMERARVQGTDRHCPDSGDWAAHSAVGYYGQLGGGDSFSFHRGSWWRWWLAWCPPFLGETHFAFMGYSLISGRHLRSVRMEYLRVLGGSKERRERTEAVRPGAFLVGRYRKLSNDLHEQTVGLARRKLLVGGLLSLLGTVGYYGSYAFVILKLLSGAHDWRPLFFDGSDAGGEHQHTGRICHRSQPSQTRRFSSRSAGLSLL